MAMFGPSLLRFLAVALTLLIAASCTRSEESTPASAPSAPSAPSAASAAPSVGAPRPPLPAASSGSTTTRADAAAPECGSKGLPDCPLQAWMKTNANPPAIANDLPALSAALEKMIELAPPGYTNWASIAKDGSAAAKLGDGVAAKASCRSCHDQYKARYRAELRGRKL